MVHRHSAGDGKETVASGAGASRRRFLGGLAALGLVIGGGSSARGTTAGLGRVPPEADRSRVRALLVSATTVAGKASLEHAETALRALYGDVSRLLLINFASLPEDRDAYAARMRRDFARVAPHLELSSLHAVPPAAAAESVRRAEAVFVSGGNTFLLLRELYDREALGVLRERTLGGMPYAGSSAGANLAGIVIGTTNDFPLVDVPGRRSLGLFAGVFNPHHPDKAETDAFRARQGKIREYARYHPTEPVLGVNNAGIVAIEGEGLTLKGGEALATVQLGAAGAEVEGEAPGNLSAALARLREAAAREGT
jgi:dipeptidase E